MHETEPNILTQFSPGALGKMPILSTCLDESSGKNFKNKCDLYHIKNSLP